MSKFWKWVEVSGGGARLSGVDNPPFLWKEIETSDLPEWVKTKMAMLDFMEPWTRLTCDSHRYLLAHPNVGVVYVIMEDEDDRNN